MKGEATTAGTAGAAGAAVALANMATTKKMSSIFILYDYISLYFVAKTLIVGLYSQVH